MPDCTPASGEGARLSHAATAPAATRIDAAAMIPERFANDELANADLPSQHFLNFFPLPQGQVSFRLAFIRQISDWPVSGSDPVRKDSGALFLPGVVDTMPGANGLQLEMMSPAFRETVAIRLWAWSKIPLLAFVRPSVIELTPDRVIIRIRLTRRTRNHLGSMYFATLCAGADTAGGLIAMRTIREEGGGVSLIFKDFTAEFLKRAEGDVHFTSEDGAAVQALVRAAIETGERQHLPVHVTATVPSKLGDEPVAKFVLTLSLKAKSPR